MTTKFETAIKRLITSAKKSGRVTLAQLNKALPDDASTPELIEEAMSMIEDAGLQLVVAEKSGATKKDGVEGSSDDAFDDAFGHVVRHAVGNDPRFGGLNEGHTTEAGFANQSIGAPVAGHDDNHTHDLAVLPKRGISIILVRNTIVAEPLVEIIGDKVRRLV